MKTIVSLIAAAAALSLAGCEQARDVREAKLAALVSCELEGVSAEARCGTFVVPEDRAKPDGRKITLEYAIIPARSKSALPDPIYILAGGPGQSAMLVAKMIMPVFSKLNQERDLVFLDQRGTGFSHPLECDDIDETSHPELWGNRAAQVALIHGCFNTFDADTRFYLTTHAIADLDAVRRELGHAKINLWGGSYGTRVALEYMRRQGDAVRSVVLDGVAPPGQKLPLSFAEDGWAALSHLLDRCAKDAACEQRYPRLMERLNAFLVTLSKGPQKTTYVDSRTGQKQSLPLDDGMFRMMLFRPLYSPELSSLVPAALHNALNGNMDALFAQNFAMMGNVSESMAMGMHLAVLCAEDVAPITPEERKAVQPSFFGRVLIEDYAAICSALPQGTIPTDYAAPIVSDVPVLMLSGGRDPATPPRHGDAVARNLKRVVHGVAPEIGHGVSQHGCAPKLIEQFIKQGHGDGLDTGCLKRIPAPPIRMPMSVGVAK